MAGRSRPSRRRDLDAEEPRRLQLKIDSSLVARIGQSNDQAIGNDLPRYEPWNGAPVCYAFFAKQAA